MCETETPELYRISQSRHAEDYYVGLLERDGNICFNFRYSLFPNPRCAKILPPGKRYDQEHLTGFKEINCCRLIGNFCHSCNLVKLRLQEHGEIGELLCSCCGQKHPFKLLSKEAMSTVSRLQRSSTCLCVCLGRRAPIAVAEGDLPPETRHEIANASQRQYEKEKTKHTRSSSESRHDMNFPKYEALFTIKVLLDYKIDYDTALWSFARDLDIPAGTIRNTYLPTLTEGNDAPFQMGNGYYFRTEERQPLKWKEEKIKAVIDFIAETQSHEALAKSEHWITIIELAKLTDKPSSEIEDLFDLAPIVKQRLRSKGAPT